MANYERTGWRDQRISVRHRLWGDKLYAVDMDWLVVEFYYGKPVVVIQYKEVCCRGYLDLDTAPLKALAWLADGREIPLWVVLYDLDANPPTYEVCPVNPTAQEQFGERRIKAEEEYIRFLYRMRGIVSSTECEKAIRKLKEGYGNGNENVERINRTTDTCGGPEYGSNGADAGKTNWFHGQTISRASENGDCETVEGR